MPGHPDGQNYAIWRGPDFLASTAFPLSNSNPVNVSGQITNFASLVITAFAAPAGGMLINVTWWTDSVHSIEVKAQQWSLPAGYFLYVILPALGNFVTVSITTPTVASTSTAIAIFPTNTAVNSASYDTNLARIGAVLNSVALSATNTHPIPFVGQGRLYIHVKDDTGSTHLTFSVKEVTQAGVVISTVWEADQPVTIVNQEITVTDVPLILTVTNSDAAAAHLYDYFIALDGRS